MREMVLNHASVDVPERSRGAVVEWLVDLSVGMQQLIASSVTSAQLRTSKELSETRCLPDYSLYDAIQGVRAAGYRDEYLSLARLVGKSPLLRDTTSDVRDRFLGAEGVSVSGEDGDPLVLCAITDWIAVGLPSAPGWDCDYLAVEFNELSPDASFSPVSESIDNVTRSRHAGPIVERHRKMLARGSDPASLWKDRQLCFPDILFGPGVEANLQHYATHFSTVVGKLIVIHDAAAAWKERGGPAPLWPIKVTDESKSLTPTHLNARRFQSHRGTTELFTWHARFGRGGRIHLRFDADTREVEVGYIGPHLPM